MCLNVHPQALCSMRRADQSSTGNFLYKKCVKAQKKDELGEDKTEYKWDIYKGDTTDWEEGQEYY